MKTKITLEYGDITKIAFDAIVNAANSSLLGGGGVDGAIHRAGGPIIFEECMKIRAVQGGCPTGEAVITLGGNLPARFVIHTVGPVFWPNDQAIPSLLGNCYRNSLHLAMKHGLKTIAFPNISTGVYGYPKSEAGEIAIQAVNEFLTEHHGVLEEIRFVCFDEENHALYSKLLSAG